MARLMDGEIVQKYLHATGGTGFYFVLPWERRARVHPAYIVQSPQSTRIRDTYDVPRGIQTYDAFDTRSCAVGHETRSIEKAHCNWTRAWL